MLAGPVAERIKFGEMGPGVGNDLSKAQWLASVAAVGDTEGFLRAAETAAEKLLREHWHRVEALAESLLQFGELGENQIHAVTGLKSAVGKGASSNNNKTATKQTTHITMPIMYRSDGYVVR